MLRCQVMRRTSICACGSLKRWASKLRNRPSFRLRTSRPSSLKGTTGSLFATLPKKRREHAEKLRAEAAARRKKAMSDADRESGELEREANEDFDLAEKLFTQAESTFVARLHQEDFCQALSVHPAIKYQTDGGPGAKQIVEVIRTNVSSHALAANSPKFSFAAEHDVSKFIDALIFNWLIGGTDAHAKNYSLLIGGGGMVRLAPLYDIASILAYPDIDPRKAKLAMKIGDRYGSDRSYPVRLAQTCGDLSP